MPINNSNKKTFCVAPWYSVEVRSDKRISPCCKFKPFKNYDYKDIEHYFNSDELNQVRKDLLTGIKNKHCAKCWRDEAHGLDSFRLISNRTIFKNKRDDIERQIRNPKSSNIISFDLTLGNLCNLKCTMCTPELSSQILAEANLNPELKGRFQKNYDQKDFDWPKTEDFVQWCYRYLPQSIDIKFTGGEPFIIPWIPDVLERIPDSQKEKCILHFTSNLTVLNDKLIESFHKFKEVWISVSVEGIDQTHEYVRYGHSWQRLVNNIKHLRDRKIQNLILKINHVVQTPSYHSLVPMVNFFDDLGILIHPILLDTPKHFHISSLTEEAKKRFLHETEGYSGINQDFIKFVRAVSVQHMQQNLDLTQECVRHLEQLDRARKNSHETIIPKQNLGKN
jgi:MoaA/NifB/PqqE/SkfB family radical SAM enzyme